MDGRQVSAGPLPDEVKEALGALVEAGEAHHTEQSRESLEDLAEAALAFAEVHWAAERARRRAWDKAADKREETTDDGYPL